MRFRAAHIRWFAFAGLCVLAVAGFYTITAYRNRPEAILQECRNAANKPLCYSSRIESTLRARGIPAAFDQLAVAYDNDPDFAATCHAVTHDLGKAAYEEYHKTGKTELTSKASYCGYGFYHGFLDTLLVDTNDLSEARSFCAYVGKNVPHPPPPEYAEGSCYHGIGHGITDGTDPRQWGNELSIVKPGLATCKKVADGNATWESRCASGVFNALGNMYNDPQFKLHPSSNPYALCRDGGFDPIDQEACYDQMNTQAAALGHNDLSAIISYSKSIADAHMRGVALHEAVSYFVQVDKYSKRQLSAVDMNACAQAGAAFETTCIDGMIGGVYEFGSPGQQFKEGIAVCSADTLQETFRGRCYAALLTLAHFYYSPDEVQRICATVPAQYTAQCSKPSATPV